MEKNDKETQNIGAERTEKMGDNMLNRHMTWWKGSWWTRVNGGSMMQKGRGSVRRGGAATRAVEEVREETGARSSNRGQPRWTSIRPIPLTS